jgi:hypothetical protein
MSKMKDYAEELWKFFDMLMNNENFALSRFGDGELTVIEGEKDFDMLKVGKDTEFAYHQGSEKGEISRTLLKESYESTLPNYFKGIPCACCVMKEKATEIYDEIEDKDFLTWANIFVNGNYPDFNTYFPAIALERDCYLISHKTSQPDKLPFMLENHWPVDSNAWIENLEMIEEIKDYIEVMEVKNSLFLVSAGPFANILCHELWKFNQDNTYIDIGSALDVYLFQKPTRFYHYNNSENNLKKCNWFE